MSRQVELIPCRSRAESHQQGLEVFARTFDHEIKNAFPIMAIRIEGQLRGYVQMENRMLITPAIHPECNSARDTLAIAKAAGQLFGQMYPGFLLQRDAKRDDVFTDALMSKLGLRPWPYRVYSQ